MTASICNLTSIKRVGRAMRGVGHVPPEPEKKISFTDSCRS